MATILDKIADIENEMARTQKNKATAGHLGMLKAKLAKLRRELITPKSQGGATEQGFEVAKVLFHDLLANSEAIIFNFFFLRLEMPVLDLSGFRLLENQLYFPIWLEFIQKLRLMNSQL